MRKPIKIILSLLFVSVFLFSVLNIVNKITYKNEAEKNIKSIPQFSYKSITEKNFTNQNLKKNSPTIFIYFNTECEFCNEEVQMIKDNITEFNEIQLIFVSFEKKQIIKKFAQKHQLTSYDNIHFLYDDKATFASTFDLRTLPCLVLYDKNQKLIEKIKGQTKAATLLKKMNQQ